MTDIAERTIDTPSRTLADPPPAKPEGNPGLIALPLIIAGATGLGFINTGIINVAAAAVPILLSATAIGLLVTTIWSAALSQNINATIYGTFFGFYGSYAVLSLGLAHNWFGIPDTGVQQTVALWLGSWLLTIGLLTVLVLRLPWTFPVLLAIVDVALVLLLVGNQTGSVAATRPADGSYSRSWRSSSTSTSPRCGRRRAAGRCRSDVRLSPRPR